MAAASEEVTASVEEVASTTNQFSSTLETMNANVQSMSRDVQEVAERASSGETAVRDVVRQISELSESMQLLADEVSGLGRLSGRDRQHSRCYYRHWQNRPTCWHLMLPLRQPGLESMGGASPL